MTLVGIPNSLESLLAEFNVRMTSWPIMTRKRDTTNLKERLNSISELCAEFRKCYPEKIYPESKAIGLIHDQILKCQKMSVGTDTEKDSFMQNSTSMLDILKTKLVELTIN